MVSPTRQLASTLFETGPNDRLATTDVYSGNPNIKPPQTVSSALDNAATAAANILKKSNVPASALSAAVKAGPGGLSVNRAVLLDRLKKATGGVGSPVGTVDFNLQTAVLLALGFQPDPGKGKKALGGGLTVSDVRFLYKDYETIVHAKNLNTATGIVNLLNGFANDGHTAQILDLTSQFAVLSTILKKAQQLGIPRAIDAIMAKIQARKDRQKFILANLRQMFTSSCTDAITTALDLVGSSGVLARVPDAIPLLLASYRLPPGTSDQSGHDTLTGLLNRINPNWTTFTRTVSTGDEVILDLVPFAGASSDSLTVLRLDPSYFMQVTIAKKFAVKALLDEAKTMYPKALFR